MSDIRLQNIQKSFGKSAPVLAQLNLSVAPNELLTVVGPSGAGKTTLLRLIAGLDQPDSGQIFLGSRQVTHLPPDQRDIAMVFQTHALYPHLTVAENLAFPLRLRSVSKAEITRQVGEMAALLHLENLLTRRPVELSGGEAQRVALGRALIRKPAASLMDEPLSSLPPDLRFRLRNELLQLHARDPRPTLYVTHDHEEALALGARVAVLQNGVVQQIATPRELYEKPANKFVASFVGRPSMNFIPQKNELIGIRPEHLEICAANEAQFQTTIESSQYLGAFTDIVARFENAQLIVRHFGAGHFSPGGPLPLRARAENIHRFDSQSGQRL